MKMPYIFHPFQSDAIFNWYSLAYEKDNEGIDDEQKEEGNETEVCLKCLSELFKVTIEQIRKEYKRRL